MEQTSGKTCRLHLYLLALLAVVALASLSGLLYFSSAELTQNRALMASGANPDEAHISISGNTITVTPVGSAVRSEQHPWTDKIRDASTGGIAGAAVDCTPDVRNVQWAVDYAGDSADVDTVVLAAGTYQFGSGWVQEPNPTVVPFPPYLILDKGIPAHADFVGIDGDLDIIGQGLPKIVGGFGTFRTFAEVDATIEGLHIDQPLASAIVVPAANNVVIKNNKITNVESENFFPLGKMSEGIAVGEMLWFPNDLPFMESIQMWMFALGNPDLLLGDWGILESMYGDLPPAAPFVRPFVPQLPGQSAPQLGNIELVGYQNFLMAPAIQAGLYVPVNDWNLMKKSANTKVKNVTIENNEIDILGDDSSSDPVVTPGDYSSYYNLVHHSVCIWVADSTSPQAIIRDNILKNAPDSAVYAGGFINQAASRVLIDGNVMSQRAIDQYDKSAIDAVVQTGKHFFGWSPTLEVTDNKIYSEEDSAFMSLGGGGLIFKNNTVAGAGETAVALAATAKFFAPVISDIQIMGNDLTGFTSDKVQISLLGEVNDSSITDNSIGPLGPMGTAGIYVMGNRNTVEGNNFSQSGIMGLKDGGQVPSVAIWPAYDPFDNSYVGLSGANFIKEQGNFVPGTGAATFQVFDFPTLYCSEWMPSSPDCSGFEPNRVVGHPADVFNQLEDANPGIGQYMKSLKPLGSKMNGPLSGFDFPEEEAYQDLLDE